MKTQLLLFLFILSINCFAQGKRLPVKEFSEKWKADSLAKNGFREQCITWDNKQREYLLNGINITHYSKKKIIRLLGKPDYEGTFTVHSCIIGGFFNCWWEKEKVRPTMGYYVCNASEKGHISQKTLDIVFRTGRKGIKHLGVTAVNHVMQNNSSKTE